jgi:hypothetical protein
VLSAAQAAEQQDAFVAAALHADPNCAASNAVPFLSGAISGSGGGSSGALSHDTPVLEPARAFFPILPCLFAAEGRLGEGSGAFGPAWSLGAGIAPGCGLAGACTVSSSNGG